jgi:hypothetical protein
MCESRTVAQVRRFYACQQRSLRWLNFAWIANAVARKSGSIVADQTERMEAFKQLYFGALRGEFERCGKSMVLFLGPNLSSNGRWSGTDLANAVRCAGGRDIILKAERNILACCWVPHDVAAAWFARRNLRFDPQLLAAAAISPARVAVSDERGETKVSTVSLDNKAVGQSLPLPPPQQDLRLWYERRVQGWPSAQKHPSADQDLQDARQAFPLNHVTREAIRVLRSGSAPTHWTAHGRRKLARK